MSINYEKYLDVLPEIQQAIDENKPVVALESTILSHGMPYPENLAFAAEIEKIIRAEGARVLVTPRMKNVGFQKTKLADDGYSEFVEY